MKKENDSTAAAATDQPQHQQIRVHTINNSKHTHKPKIRNVGKKVARNLHFDKKKRYDEEKKTKSSQKHTHTHTTHSYKLIQTGLFIYIYGVCFFLLSIVYTDLKPLIHTVRRSVLWWLFCFFSSQLCIRIWYLLCMCCFLSCKPAHCNQTKKASTKICSSGIA